eukprot:3374451-Prymnesium_polylepis.1
MGHFLNGALLTVHGGGGVRYVPSTGTKPPCTVHVQVSLITAAGHTAHAFTPNNRSCIHTIFAAWNGAMGARPATM